MIRHIPFAALILFTVGAFAQAATALPAFEVATIKPAAPSPDGHTHINYPLGDRFSAANIPLLALMQWAYNMPEKQILNASSWLSSTRFDIQATSDPSDEAKHLTSQQNHDIKRQMLQALFADRFHLKLHQETRNLPAYDLVLAKGGSKLQPSHSNGKTVRRGNAYFNAEGLTASLIAEELSQIAGRIVVDKTDLTGRYDLKLQWTPDDVSPTDNSAPSFFTALQEQLGLKLEPAKEAVPVLVIDHVDLPTPN